MKLFYFFLLPACLSIMMIACVDLEGPRESGREQQGQRVKRHQQPEKARLADHLLSSKLAVSLGLQLGGRLGYADGIGRRAKAAGLGAAMPSLYRKSLSSGHQDDRGGEYGGRSTTTPPRPAAASRAARGTGVVYVYKEEEESEAGPEGVGGERPLSLRFAEENFTYVASLAAKAWSRQRPVLLHARNSSFGLGRDVVTLYQYSGENESSTSTILEPSVYDNLKAVSHLPVSVALSILPELSTNASSKLGDDRNPLENIGSETQEKLQAIVTVATEVSQLIRSGGIFQEGAQTERQLRIVETVLDFAQSVLDGTVKASVSSLRGFVAELETDLDANADDAITDYLSCLNVTISKLLSSGPTPDPVAHLSTISVVIAVQPFARERRSFLLEYYEQLLSSDFEQDTDDPERIIVMDSLSSSLDDQACDRESLGGEGPCAVSVSMLEHNTSQVFYGSPYTPLHELLTSASERYVCSSEFSLPGCYSEAEENYSLGFRSTTEQIYVIIIIFLGTLTVATAIFISCLCHEDLKMQRERKRGIGIEALSLLSSDTREAQEEELSDFNTPQHEELQSLVVRTSSSGPQRTSSSHLTESYS